MTTTTATISFNFEKFYDTLLLQNPEKTFLIDAIKKKNDIKRIKMRFDLMDKEISGPEQYHNFISPKVIFSEYSFKEEQIYFENCISMISDMMETTPDNEINFKKINEYKKNPHDYKVVEDDEVKMMGPKNEVELYKACLNGDMSLAKTWIERGATSFNTGLEGACKGNNVLMTNFMIEIGATDFNYGLVGACEGDNVSMIDMMIEKGATSCWYCENTKHKQLPKYIEEDEFHSSVDITYYNESEDESDY